MEDRPTAQELLAAIAELLESEVLPAVDSGLQHKVRVAANLSRIISREITLGPANAQRERAALAALLGIDADLAELNALAAERMAGADDEFLRGAVDVLLAGVLDKLEVDKPGYAGLS